jgi:CRP/FNR family transcriptional regulator, cyclic AMP receptor protein
MHEQELAKVPLFRELSARELQVLGATCHERDFTPGQVLLRQGDTAAGLFIIVSGKVRVTQHQEGGAEHELNTLGPGDVLGEMALLDDLPRSATATAVEPTHVLMMPVWDFRATLREHPDIGVKLLSVLSQRLRRAEQRES